jgi:hypothetical protein
MTQPNAPIAAEELRARIRDLDARGQRPAGLVMSPETWALLSTDAESGDRVAVAYAGLPVWVRTDCEGVELIQPTAAPAAAPEEVWL